MKRRALIFTLLAAAGVLAGISTTTIPARLGAAFAQTNSAPRVETSLVPGVALAGFDAVAYFTLGKPTEGRRDITLQHMGAEWRFASDAHRAAFRADPSRYAPQYGGHCSWAVANGYPAKGDPEAWRIEAGRLYLNYDLSIKARWEEDIPGNIAKSEMNWPKLVSSR
jgi:hypothetical protein